LQGLFLTSCNEHEITKRDYPRLDTKSVADLSASGATFRAEITFRGDFEISELGFIWSDTPLLELMDAKGTVYSQEEGTTFSSTVSAEFDPATKYYVKSFVRTPDYLVYGQAVEFSF
jgi:hypothetical protein